MMIDVSIATVYSKGILTIFCLFSVFFLFVCKKKTILHFCVLVLINMFLRTKPYIFDAVIVSCMTAGSELKMVASELKRAALWRHCDAMTRHKPNLLT